MVDAKKTIAVVGLGRFGTLWAQLFAEQGCNVLVYDIASKGDSVHHSFTVVSKELLLHANYVFFCVPISALAQSIQSLSAYIHPKALVCDTCSVKVRPINWLRDGFSKAQPIVGLHPLFGPDSVAQKEFRQIVVCRVRASEVQYQECVALLKLTGGTIIEMTAEEHDRQSVYSQGLTHLIGRTLGSLTLRKEEVSTKGYESLLEIIRQTCNDSEELFRDILQYNDNTGLLIEELQTALKQSIGSLRGRDGASS